MNVYHYTTPDRLFPIMANGLQPATAFLPKGERPVIWFTTSEDYEPTALKGVLTKQGAAKASRAKRRGVRLVLGIGDTRTLSREEQMRGLGLARIEVAPETAAVDWHQWRREALVDPIVADRLQAIAVERDSDVNLWRVSFARVAPEHFLGMDVWHEGAWLRVAERTETGFMVLGGPPSPFPVGL